MSDAVRPLAGRRIALLIEEGFSARQVIEPRRQLGDAGASVVLVGFNTKTEYRDKTGTLTLTADDPASRVRVAELDALVIPGGYAPDRMRLRHAMVDLATGMMTSGRTVAAICHGPQLLITANVLRGRTLTCWPSIAVDVKNAGGLYVDRPVVRDSNLITARKSQDLPLFLDALVTALSAPPVPARRP